MKQEKIDNIQVIVLCLVIAFFLMMSMKVNAQTTHVVDTVKYHYFDLKGRIVNNKFFYEKNLGWKNYFLAYDGIRTRKVWIDTTKNK